MGAAATDVEAVSPAQSSSLPELPPLDAQYETATGFSDFANWLIPGRVLLGRYPFVEPARIRKRTEGEAMIRQIITAGATTFVCLQAEVPCQSEMRIGGEGGYLPYRPSATIMASSLSAPPSLEEVGALRTPELDRYLPPRRLGPSAYQLRKRIEIQFVHCPIVDLSVPEPDRLRLLLADLAERLESGEQLYIHCWGGRGRAGTVGACLLAHLYGLSAEEALTRVQRAFDTRQDEGRRSPETEEQRAFVTSFIQQYST